MEKRILSVCLTACMLLTLMPSAFAADAEQPLPIAGMEQTEETSADARTEPGDEPQEPVPTEEGKGTAYNEAVKGDALDGKDVYLTISRTEFKEGQFALTNVQTRPNPPRLHLTLTDCTFTGNTAGDKTNSSFMYLPNCQSLVIKGCTFNAGEDGLKYGINWNLCGIQGSTVEIRGCTFTGSYKKNAIKLNQRNGEDDAAEDVKPSGDGEVKPATIASAVVADCTFSEGAKIQLGSQGKGENNAAAPSTGAFPVTISNVKAENGSEVAVELAYQAAKDADIPTITLASGDTFEKTEEGVLVAQVGETKYTSIDEALTAALSAEDHTLTLLQDVTKDISIAAGSTLTIEGNGKTLYGTVNCSVASGDDANQTNTNLTLNNLTVDGDTNRDGTADKSILITSQNQSATVVSGLNLTMTNCTVQNSKAGVSGGQGLYLTNVKNLTIDDCTFTNCGGINYAIDLNLVAVQDAVISITNTRFEGNCGASGPIKVAERGTGDGTEADDITGARASVKSLTISGCTFNNSNPILGGDIVLGVTTKTGEKDGNDTGSFPVTIADNKTTKEDKQLKIKLAYTDDSARDITTDIGSAVVGDGTTDPAQGFTITATAGEGGAITPSGKVAVAKGGSQTFTVTADSGYSISDVTVDDSTAADVVQNDNGTYTDRPTGTYSGDAVTEWVFNEERQEGDLTLIESGDNYYVVLFHSRGRNDYNTVDVRHILFKVDTSDLDSKADDYQEKLDARKAEQKEAAEAALKKWEEGARTEDSFAELANELSADTGSNTKGGLYTEVYKGQMVTEFNDWCFDESRQPGDTGIVYNEGSYTGYHVIYFVGTDAPYWQVQVRNAMKNADYTQWNNALVKDITATEASGMKYLV